MAKRGSIFLNLLNFIPQKIKNIIDYLKDIDDILNIKSVDLKNAGLWEEDIKKILQLQQSNILDREEALIKKERINVIDIFDKEYPLLLKEIDNPPVVLYLLGDSKILDKFLFAIVGSRKSTSYGLSIAREFSCRLSSLGIVIVSGLARGIDTSAHKGAIVKGESVAVLGSGLLNIYPRENKYLFKEIIKRGVVLSEFPLLTPPLQENFPRRNRIISGLSKGVLVVEAALRSGALITARLACEQNRDVFAIPGKIDSPLSNGTNALIKEGAKLVNSVEDILEELNLVAC
ncbi:MAG: DNA-processing protein DprA [Candidatus Omnitrophica bacterium]|jgi:DNA processing protein|nr:DNA-processing protein DprA [Candidatus Omnitrophota bacterium]